MKARIRATEGLWFDVEAEQEDELFKQIARIQEIFHHQGCGQRINEKAYADKNREYLPDKGWFIYKPIDRYKPN